MSTVERSIKSNMFIVVLVLIASLALLIGTYNPSSNGIGLKSDCKRVFIDMIAERQIGMVMSLKSIHIADNGIAVLTIDNIVGINTMAYCVASGDGIFINSDIEVIKSLL